MSRLLCWLNDMWPWRTPMDRALTYRIWQHRRAITRAHRIRQRPEHTDRRQPGVVGLLHGPDPAHCVCNGTHVEGSYCPRCPQPYWIAQSVHFL